MKKEDIRILIAEDDVILGKALKQAVDRAGFHADHFARPDEALSATKRQSYHACVVDCMPPQNARD